MINPEVVNGANQNERESKDCNGGHVVGVSETTNESNLKLIEITWLRIVRVSYRKIIFQCLKWSYSLEKQFYLEDQSLVNMY